MKFCPDCGCALTVAPPHKCASCGYDPGHLVTAPTRIRPDHQVQGQYFDQKGDRYPIGALVMAFLMTGSGLFLSLGMVALVASRKETQALVASGSGLLLLIWSVFLISTSFLAGGIGLFMRSREGWYLGLFSMVFSLIRSLTSMVNFLWLARKLHLQENLAALQYLKLTGRCIITTLVICYLFRENVLKFYGQENVVWWKVLGSMIVICIGIILFNYLLFGNVGIDGLG